MTYDKEIAARVTEIVKSNQSVFPVSEIEIIRLRRLACQCLVFKIENWLFNHSVKNVKVTLQEYSDVEPKLNIDLPYKTTSDSYGLYFNRTCRIGECRLWLPYSNWTNYWRKTHKKNDLIMEEFWKEFTLERIALALNYPFPMSDYNDGKWIFKDGWNIT